MATKPRDGKATGKKKVSNPGPSRKKKAPAKKTGARKKAPPKKKKSNLAFELKKTGLGIAILLAVCLTLAMLADIFIKSSRPIPEKKARIAKTRPAAAPAPAKTPAHPAETRPAPEPAPVEKPVVSQAVPEDPGFKKRAAGLKGKNGHAIVYEVFEDLDPHHGKKPAVPPKIKEDTPRIAIIIDDIGYDRRLAMALFDVEPAITFSVLPFSPHGRSLSRRLHAKGAELMLHLPMEPMEYPRINPGPGALLSSMGADELLKRMREDLDDIAGVSGVNNHMGSRLTADADKMNQIFTILKKRDLFFIDSRTSAKSKGEASARLFRLRFSQRDIFLDNFQNIEYISGQLKRLVKVAEKHGTAIGIGHPYQATLDTLRRRLPELKGRVQVVRASRLVAIPG